MVDAHEQYAYRLGGQQVRTVSRALPCGDYGVTVDGRLVASVERKSLSDLVSSLLGGKLRGRHPRLRLMDLQIAVTAAAHSIPLITRDLGGFAELARLLDGVVV